MSGELRRLDRKSRELIFPFVNRAYKNAKAQEHATHGFARRVKILKRSIENVYEILPLDLERVPESDEITDATINIHAFLINVFGSLDNLAWVWVCEREVVGPKGNALSNSQVGFGKKYQVVRNSFTAEFRDYLNGLDRWFACMEGFRHALAHRISPYIPPYTIDPSKLEEYRGFEELKADAIRRSDATEFERLSAEQMCLTKFTALYTHSLKEKASQMAFHAQLLADFNTVHELGLRLIAELDRIVPASLPK